MPTRISRFFFSNPRRNPRTRMPPFVCPPRSPEEHLQSAREQTYYAKFFKRWKRGMKDSVLCQLTRKTVKCHPLYRKIPHQPMR
ncbi:uncharacterized protein LOC128170945 [Crassostrea angulata]|uniref:uncharacterized protein LOC128170945 n=1 Tax=Magallana angulata TaxID=2784310 RepID=UPI0022B20C43|nr:uncharacterized protein LOC128170945 [Crassostrea angulata]